MVTPSQAKHVMALVHERHIQVRNTFDALLNAYAAGEMLSIINANDQFRVALHSLEAVVAAEHCPTWLKDLVLNADRYATRHENGITTWRAHLESAINNSIPLGTEDWSFNDHDEILFDADMLVANARSKYKIDQLYSQIIDCLDKLISYGEIDSSRALSDLGKITSTLRVANSGSFSAQIISWRFAKRLVLNIITAFVKRSDVTGPIVEAIEKTALELDISLEKAMDKISRDVRSAASSLLRTEVALTTNQETILLLNDLSEQSAEQRSSEDKE